MRNEEIQVFLDRFAFTVIVLKQINVNLDFEILSSVNSSFWQKSLMDPSGCL